MKKFSSIMRVNSHRTSKVKKVQRMALLGIFAVVLLFVVPKVVATAASMVMMPVHVVENWFSKSTDSFPQYLRERSKLLDELNALTYTQSAQSGDRLTSVLLTQENQELRELLGIKGERRLVAGVIGRPNKMPYDVLVLDKGTNDGLVEGAPVFIGDDAVIGIISKTFAHSAVVTLVTTPGFTVSVYIIGPNIYTNAVGQGGGLLRIGVPQGIKLSEGNLVILPGVDAGIYGAIGKIQSVASEPEQYGFVSPEVPLASLRLVSVGTVSLEPKTFEEAQKVVSTVVKTVFEVPIPEGVLVTVLSSTTSSTTASSTLHTTSTTP